MDVRKRIIVHLCFRQRSLVCDDANGTVLILEMQKPDGAVAHKEISPDHICPQLRVPEDEGLFLVVHRDMQAVLRQKTAAQMICRNAWRKKVEDAVRYFTAGISHEVSALDFRFSMAHVTLQILSVLLLGDTRSIVSWERSLFTATSIMPPPFYIAIFTANQDWETDIATFSHPTIDRFYDLGSW